MSQADILSTIAQVTGIGPKHWQPFDEKSPGGVPMTGYICLQESDYLGALALTTIGGKERFEIIRCTRLNPVLTASRWGDWPAMLNKVLPDRSGVERAVRDQKLVLAFEL
jgi:hypothetical protein